MKGICGALAVAGLMLVVVPQQRAEAMSLIGSGAAVATTSASENMTIQVRGHRGGRHRGGRFHRGRGFFFGPAYYEPGPYCGWINTVYGPRRVCRRVPWW